MGEMQTTAWGKRHKPESSAPLTAVNWQWLTLAETLPHHNSAFFFLFMFFSPQWPIRGIYFQVFHQEWMFLSSIIVEILILGKMHKNNRKKSGKGNIYKTSLSAHKQQDGHVCSVSLLKNDKTGHDYSIKNLLGKQNNKSFK